MSIERYLNIRSAYGPAFAAEGEWLAFLMDTTGVPQIWTLDGSGRWPEQRTFDEERVTFVSASPTRDELIFGMDEGGNERQQFYRLELHGSGASEGAHEPIPLTDSPEAKHLWGGWSADGSQFAFTSNRRDRSVFDVYVQERTQTGNEARLLHESDGWVTVGGWSPDDSRLIVHRAHSNFDMDVFVLDLTSQAYRHVTPHEGDVRFGSPEWSPDGDALYLTTDAGADTTYLARLDLSSLDIDPVVEGGDWNVEEITIHRDSGRVAFTRNVEGYTELTVGQLTGETTIQSIATPDLPDGIYAGLDFDPGGERLALTITGRTLNANIFALELPEAESPSDGPQQSRCATTLARWTQASTAGLPPSTFVRQDIIHYETFDGRELPAFLSMPPDAERPFPAIVDIHGGPESQRRPSFSAVTQYFLANGYAVFEPNVRGSTGYGKTFTRLDDKRQRMDAVADLAAGAEWLGERPTIDADRLVAMGASYGGFMVLAGLTEYPDLWAAGIDIVGIANFVTFLEHTGDWRRSLREAEYGSLDEDRAFLEEISPINHIEAIRAPLFVLHGANDPRVPVGEAEQIAEEASEHVPVETLIFDDEGHGLSKLDNRIEAYRAIVAFLDEHLATDPP